LNDVQKEAAVLKKKVTELQNVQSVINGELLWCSIYIASEVTTLWRYTNLLIIIIIIT